jgi:hypothetical protein
VLASLAPGDSPQGDPEDFPSLSAEEIRAAIAFAAASAAEDIPLPPSRWMKIKLDETLPLRLASRRSGA